MANFRNEVVFPEFRTDVLTGRLVLIAPARLLRPSAFLQENTVADRSDPFQEGNEHETPSELFAIREFGVSPNGPGWRIRVVPNRFPAVTGCLPESNPERPETGPGGSYAAAPTSTLFPRVSGFGQHEVVIECPEPRTRFLDFNREEAVLVFQTWRRRVLDLSRNGRISAVTVFRNEGVQAGASLPHCHSQIIATELTTPGLLRRCQQAAAYRREYHRDLLQDLTDAELQSGQRIVMVTDHFTVLCPFAPRTSWHVRLVPRRPEASRFQNSTDEELLCLANTVPRILKAIHSELGAEFSFNILVIDPPFTDPELFHPQARSDSPRADSEATHPAFGWMLEILPRTGKIAGWEYSSDTDIVTVSPEFAAERLRERLKE